MVTTAAEHSPDLFQLQIFTFKSIVIMN